MHSVDSDSDLDFYRSVHKWLSDNVEENLPSTVRPGSGYWEGKTQKWILSVRHTNILVIHLNPSNNTNIEEIKLQILLKFDNKRFEFSTSMPW